MHTRLHSRASGPLAPCRRCHGEGGPAWPAAAEGMAWTSRAGGEGGLREKESVRGPPAVVSGPEPTGTGGRDTTRGGGFAGGGLGRPPPSPMLAGLGGGAAPKPRACRAGGTRTHHDHGTAAEGAGSSGASGWAETISSGWAEMSERMGRESEASSGASGWALSDDFKSTCGLSVEEPTSRREVASRPPV